MYVMCIYTYVAVYSAPREIEENAGWHPLLGAYEWFTRVVSSAHALYTVHLILSVVLVLSTAALCTDNLCLLLHD
jgi:hypothetical protein